jgi:hypothetical protein
MKLPEHVTLSILLSQFGVQQHYGPAGTGLMIAAGCLPDLDGLTIFFGWRFYRKYHRIVGHGLPVSLFGPPALAFLGWWWGVGPWLPLWGWVQVALMAHLFTDVCFYNWPAQLLWPLSPRGAALGLLEWNDLVPTLILYVATAVALGWPQAALPAAAGGIGAVLLYLAWRAWRPRAESGWAAWLTGDWAADSLPVWRWLTGDFIT